MAERPLSSSISRSPVRTEGTLERFRSAGAHRGARVVVFLEGQQIWDLAWGEGAPGEALAADGLSLWFSATKPLAAVLVASAWEQGLLELDSPVAVFVPEFAGGGKEGVTIRHLLTHTAGIRLPHLPWPEAPWDEIIATICRSRIEPRWRPGRDAGYHLASSWFVLAEILRRLDGRPFEQRVRDDLLVPLSCTSSWVGLPSGQLDELMPRVLPMWDTSHEPALPLPALDPQRLERCNPGANGIGPLSELARVWEMLRRGGALDGVRILSPQTTEALLARHRVGMMDRTFRANLDWGLGVIPNSARSGDQAASLPYHYGSLASPRAVGHSGARSCVALCDRDFALTLAVWWNGTPSDQVHAERAHQTLTAIYEDLGLA